MNNSVIMNNNNMDRLKIIYHKNRYIIDGYLQCNGIKLRVVQISKNIAEEIICHVNLLNN